MDDQTVTNLTGGGATQAIPSHTAQNLRTPAPSLPSEKDFSGTTLGGYQLVRKIAEGGMGVVYEAIQTNLSRRVALKILNEELASRTEFLERFRREAKAAAALNHPNVVQVHDFGENQGWCYLIMEYVDGHDLSDYVDEHGKLSIVAALDIVEQAAQALKAASERAIIHRDIKPSNLMLTTDGRVKISDLGLAKILTEASDLTLSGIGMGSPYFMAPEQANDAREVDHRADIYALGLTLLFLLTGKRPYDGNTPFSIVLAHANKPLPRGVDLGTELPAEVEGLVQRMSAKDPAARYANYDLLIADVRRVKAGYAPASQLSASPRGFEIRKFAPWILVLILILAGGIFFWSKIHNRSIDEPAAQKHMASRENLTRGPRENLADRDREPPEDFRGPPDEGEPEPMRGPDSRVESVHLPLEPLPRPNLASLPDGPVNEMLAQADDYALKHPNDFKQTIDRYRQVLSKARGTPADAEINKKMDKVIARHQGALRQALHDYEARMQEKMRSGTPQQAYDVWKTFPSNLRTRESDKQIEQMLARTLPPGFVPR
jgi:serine/threonine protein kinase